MDVQTPPIGVVRFGVFELDGRTGELRRHGQKIRLPHQSFEILRLLLSRPGDVVTRDELRHALWAPDTFVDFDVGLNSAIRKLRDALDDSADEPRFVETLPRRGYRFIGVVEAPAAVRQEPPSRDVPSAVPAASGGPPVASGVVAGRGRWIWGIAAVAAALAALAIFMTPQRTQPAIHPDAYAAYLKGKTALGAQRYEGFRTAVAYFEQAVARQPDFAEGYAALAHAQYQFLFGGPLSPRETIPKAEAAARKAIELDDTVAQAHRTLGLILAHYYWRWEEGDRELQRAAALGRSSDEPVGLAGVSLIRHGRVAEAITEAEDARRRDPMSFPAQVNVGIAYRAAGQYDRAIAELRRALEMSPGHTRAHFHLGVTYVAMDDIQSAIRELETATRSPQGRNARMAAYLGYAYARAGRTADARRILDELETSRREQYVSSFGIALIYDALGEKEPALAALERAVDDRAVEFAQMRQYPAFTTIASEPRFEAVMRRVGLPR